MGFLLAFVDKEKHAEALAEKLCQRLDATKADDDDAVAKATGDVDAQTASRDWSFCLGKLMLTEKVTRKLAEYCVVQRRAAGRGRVCRVHRDCREGSEAAESGHEGVVRRLGGEAPRGS